jgi:hypothetical protein
VTAIAIQGTARLQSTVLRIVILMIVRPKDWSYVWMEAVHGQTWEHFVHVQRATLRIALGTATVVQRRLWEMVFVTVRSRFEAAIFLVTIWTAATVTAGMARAPRENRIRTVLPTVGIAVMGPATARKYTTTAPKIVSAVMGCATRKTVKLCTLVWRTARVLELVWTMMQKFPKKWKGSVLRLARFLCLSSLLQRQDRL